MSRKHLKIVIILKLLKLKKFNLICKLLLESRCLLIMNRTYFKTREIVEIRNFQFETRITALRI